tara:strand:- start:908 stop:1258 length:351 start_codon:yes stop_codon:yes gene_type:complete
MSQTTEDIYDDMPELEKINETAEMRADEEKDKETCLQLQNLFHMAMLYGSLPYLKTKEKMMNYLNRRGDPDWTAGYIWGLANNNKINWVKCYSDPTPYEKYKKNMNEALAKYLHTE